MSPGVLARYPGLWRFDTCLSALSGVIFGRFLYKSRFGVYNLRTRFGVVAHSILGPPPDRLLVLMPVFNFCS